MAIPGVFVRIAFGSLPGAGEPLGSDWIDLSSKVKSVSLDVGRDLDLNRIESSTAVVVFDNQDGNLIDWNTQGAWYPKVRAMTQVEIAWTSDVSLAFKLGTAPLGGPPSVLYDTAPSGPGVFRGLIETVSPAFLQNGVSYECTITLTGLFRYLTTLTASGDRPIETVGARIAGVLATAGNPFPTAIDAAGYTVAAETASGNLLDYIRSLADLDGGIFYERGDGNLCFIARSTLEASSTFGTVQATIGNVSGIRCLTLQTSSDEQYIYNQVTAKTSDGTAITPQQDTTSQSYYLTRPNDLGTSRINNTTDLTLRAKQELIDNYLSRLLVNGLTFQLLDPSVDAQTLVGLDIMDRIHVGFQPNVGSALSVDCLVQGWSHTITASPRSWIMTLKVSATPTKGFILGVANPDVDAL